jgi:hypothetical protein
MIKKIFFNEKNLHFILNLKKVFKFKLLLNLKKIFNEIYISIKIYFIKDYL